jgi:WhiB family redox-sensing transcriptional regulator
MSLNAPSQEIRRTEPVDVKDWRARSACRDEDPEMFFPGTGAGAEVTTRSAKAVCAGCPVLEQCRTWALDSGQEGGIFGGMTERERKRVLRSRAGLTGTNMTASLLEMAQAVKLATRRGTELRRWLAEGVSMEQMAKRLTGPGMGTGGQAGTPRIRVVRLAFHRLGVQLPVKYVAPLSSPPHPTPAMDKVRANWPLVTEMRAAGNGLRPIAAKLGVNPDVVRKALNEVAA